ncbi:MAG: cadherin-like beta sandwich domain-containing protein [Bacteroidota bacterium]
MRSLFQTKFFYFIAVCLFSFSAKAQLSSYTFSQGIEGYTAITGGTVLWSGAGIDDDPAVNVAIPSFNFNGINYNSCYITPNGFITFGSEPNTVEYRPISSSVSTYSGAISAFGWDLVSSSTGSPEVRCQQVNEEFIIQWQDFKRNSISTIEKISFQIKLNSLTNVIKIVYGGSIFPTNNTTYPQVGIRGASNSNFRNRKVVAATGIWLNSTEGTLNNDNCYFNSVNSGTVPISGLTFIWTAPCVNASIPYSINFDDVEPYNIPNCTSIQDLNGANTWNVEEAPTDTICFNGNVLAYNWDGSTPGDDWFFSKGISLTAGSTYTLQYVYGAYDVGFPESMEVKFGLSATPVAMTNSIASHPLIESRFEQVEVNFSPASTGVYHLGFHANSDPDMYNLYLDDILLSNYTPCTKPTSLSAYNANTTSVVVSFTAGGSETEWQIEYGVAPYVFTGLSMATFTSNTFTLTGLNPGTKYQFKVRGNCGASKSLWTRLQNFITPCNPTTTLPLAQSFDNSQFPACWSASLISGEDGWEVKNFDSGISAPKSGTNFIGKTNTDSEALLISPPLNLNGLGATPVQISSWLYRSSTSDVNDKITFYVNNSSNLTGAVQLLEIFTNIGVAPTVGTDGWYNYKVTIPTSYNTNGTFYVIAKGSTSADAASNALGIDEFRLELVASLDIQANTFINPSTVGCYSSSENVSVVVENVGNTLINFATNNLVLNANVTGTTASTITTTINSGTLAAGALATYSVGNANMLAVGNYFISGSANLSGDLSTSNNTFETAIREKFSTYALPYTETFNSYTNLSDAPIWNGNGDWIVADNQGTAGTKSYITQVNLSFPQATTITKFNLGTVTSATSLTLDYRIVDEHDLSSAPSAATTLVAGDFIKISLSTDCGASYTLFHTINNGNHTPSLSFTNKNLSLAAYAGQNIQFKIEVQSGGSNDFYFNMDNFNVVQPLDNNANLSNLVSSQGSLNPTFASGTTNYTVTLPIGSSGSAILTPTLASSLSITSSNTSASNVAGNPPTNIASVVVMAQTGATQTYTVTYNVITLNSNSSLSNLTTSVGSFTFSFAPGIYNYTVNLPTGTTGTASLTPTLATTLSTITSNTSATDVGGTAPANIATVVVTAENGSTSTYTVTYNTSPLNSNSSLATLVPNRGDLVPTFSPSTFNYTVTLPFGSTGSDNLSATVASSLSVISSNVAASNVANNNGVDNVATVVVTAQDASTSTYTVTYTVEAGNTNSSLTALTSSVGTISPVFASSTFSYTVTLPIGSSGSATLTPTLATTLSTITSNVSASNVNGSAPNNTAYVIVTAQTGATSTYTVVYNVVQPSTDATLATLTSNIGSFTTTFNPSVLSYTVVVPQGTTGASIISATAVSTSANVTITQATDVSGAAPANVATVVVTAQDGTTILTYTITYSFASGLNELNKGNIQVEVYPNPVINKVFIKVTSNTNSLPLQIEVLNVSGQILYAKQVNSCGLICNYDLDLSDLPQGIYFVKLHNEMTSEIKRVVKN